MNYRHAFHAGNFADVFKHALLTRLLLHLARKDTPFRVIDTHAGDGFYNLSGAEAARTGEWRGGIGRLAHASMPDDARALFAPYLNLVGALPTDAPPSFYPGSPAIAAALMRPQDRALFCELHPQAFAALQDSFARDKRVKFFERDGFAGLNAFLPPPERRGLVLIDPPFEARDEAQTMIRALVAAYRKWPTAIYALWYPVKSLRERDAVMRDAFNSGIARMLRLELATAPVIEGERLTRTGLLVINPPYQFADEAAIMLGALSPLLETLPGKGSFTIDWIASE